MTRGKQPLWTASVAVVAAYAIVLQALLSSLSFVSQTAPTDFDGLFGVTCLTSAGPNTQQAPILPMDHRHDGCCVLCSVPALDAVWARTNLPAPAYALSNSSHLTESVAGPPGTIDRLPGRPRAPPRGA